MKILSIDPGTTGMGWAYSEFIPSEHMLYVKECGAIYPAKVSSKEYKRWLKIFGQRLFNLKIVQREYELLVHKFKCDFHASEDAFFNFKSPLAFALLSTCIHTCSATLLNAWEDGVITAEAAVMHKYAPRHIKKIISVMGGVANKGDVCEAVIHHPYIKIEASDMVGKSHISHITDAIACGYTFVHDNVPGAFPYVQK